MSIQMGSFKQMTILIAICLLLLSAKLSNGQASISGGPIYSYNPSVANGPSNWANSWDTCSLSNNVQSPIHISMAPLDNTLNAPLFNVQNNG